MVAPTSDASPPKAALSPQPHLEYLGWGPTGNAFVYVHQSNLYYRDAGAAGGDMQGPERGISFE